MNHQLANRRISTSEPYSSRAPPNFGGGDQFQADDNDGRDYKLIIDPALGQGKDKVIRYNGCMPGRDLVPIGVVDPRPRISRYSLSRHSVNLKIPDFQVDQNYVGKILPKEVTLTNLNNNINVTFLQDMCKAFGDIKTSVIFYHPKTKKHLGIAQVVFTTARAAQRCIEKLNETSKMGNIISVFADPSGDVRRKLLDDLMTDKVIFRPPSPKLQLPVNIMDELKNLAPPPVSSLTATKSNGIGKPTSKTASPSTNTTAPRSATLRTNVYSDPDLRRSHSNGGAPFPSSQRGDNVYPGRAELPTIRRQSTGCAQAQTTDPPSGFYHHQQQHQQQSSQSNAWHQSHHDESQPEARPPSVSNHSSAFSSGQHEATSYSEATSTDRPNWRRRIPSERNQTLGYAPQTTNSLDGFGPQIIPENLCGEGGFNPAYPPPAPSERRMAVDLGFDNSNESFHLGRQSNTNTSFQKQISQEAFRRAKNSPTNFASQNSQEPFGQPESSHMVSFGLQSSRDVAMRSLDSQQTPTSQLSQVGFWPEEVFRQVNSPAAFAQQNSLSNFRQNSLSEVHEKLSELPALQKSVSDQSAVETGDPRKLKGSRTWDKDSKDPRQQREDQPKRQQSRDKVDFRKSSSHDMETSHDSKHASRRHDGSRHRNRNHDSSHGRHRSSHHKRHRSSHHRHRSSSRESSSKPSVSRDSSDQRGLMTAVLADVPQVVAVPPLPSDCLPPSNDVLPSVAESFLPHPSLESRIQQLLGQAEERNSINGFSGLVFPPPLPPEQPPPPPPPVEAELPPLPPEPAPLDEVVDVSMGQGIQHTGRNNSMFVNYSEKTNYIYNSSVNCKAGKTKAGSMSRHTGSLPGTHFNDESIDSVQQTTSSEIVSDSFRSELQYPAYWYAPYPPPTEVSNGLPVDNSVYGNLPIDNGLYGNLPFDNALYSMAAYGGAFGLAPVGLSREELVDEGNFGTILEELVGELKKVMVKDMQKKMVENIGFKVYENWWKNEENREKVMMVQKPILDGVKSKLESKPPSSVVQTNAAPVSLAPSTSDVVVVVPSVSSTAPLKPCDSSSLLSSLFDNNKDGGGAGGGGRVGFGGGGLLGLRGVVAKMPSFRKKLPSPLPEKERDYDDEEEEEDDDDEEEEEEEEPMTFRGPRTPEESENEEELLEDEEDSSSSSLGDEDLVNSVKLLQRTRPSRAFLYSSTSSSSSSGDEEEEEDEQVSQGEDLTAESDVDGDQSEVPEVESDEGPKQKRRQMLSSDDDDEVVVVATKPDKDKIHQNAKPRHSNDAEEPLPSSLSLPSAVAAAASLASGFTHILDDKRTPVTVVLPDSRTVVTPSSLKPDSVSPESVVPDHSGRAEEMETDEKSEALRHEDSMKNEPMMHDRLQDKNKELVSLPTIKPLHLVEEWLSAMRLDHAYSLSPALYSAKKGRKPRVQFSIRDDDLDVDLSDDTLSLSDSAIGLTATLPSRIALDHNYCHPFFPVHEPRVVSDSDGEPQVDPLPVRIITDSGEVLNTEDVPNILMEVDVVEEKPVEEKLPVTRKRKRLSDVTNFPGSRELANILPPVVRKPEYCPRGQKEQTELLQEFLCKGLDAEDMAYLKRQYDELVQEDYPRTYWVNETHWVNHPPTFELSPPRKRSRTSRHHDSIDHHHQHTTGSARTEGYYKISRQAKSLYLRHTRGVDDDDNLDDDQKRCLTDEVARKKSQQSRDVRSESRRWQNLFTTDLGDEMGDILKFNKLEIRKKQLKFARSRIHDWGLFAKEPIAEGEMVIEYVGQVVRRSVADALEKRYEALGIGSSYLFRVDHNVVIDATKHGNLSRFVNHSCSPNCYAKIITVDSEKKIVIYSKRDIQINDEITYDYKFPLEDEKIPCLCGASGCRGTLN